MSFIHFTDWIKKERIVLDEKQLGKRDLAKDPTIIDKLQKIFGLVYQEKDVNSDTGFFQKKDGTYCILRPSAAYDIIDPKWLTFNMKDAIVPLGDDTFKLHISDKKIHQAGEGDDPAALKNIYIPMIGEKATELQEVIQSIIMEMKVKGIDVGTMIDKDLLLEMPKDKKGKELKYKRSKLEEWMLCSDPDQGTGLCQFIDFDCEQGDGLQLRRELETFFLRSKNKWYKVFDQLYSADLKNLISSVFKKKDFKWASAKFCHYRNMTLPAGLRATLEKYLGNTRLGQKKDNIDKTDIVLMFNTTVGQKIMTEAMNARSNEEHNIILNRAFCTKQLMGISLKKLVDGVNVMAANFNPSTTAVGDEIVEDKTICVEYHGRDKASMKLNTFGPVTEKDVIKPEKDDGKSSGIILHLNNKKHIHCGSDTIKFDVRSGGSSMKYEFREEKHPAFGNAAIPLNKDEDGRYPAIETSISDELEIASRTGKTFADVVYSKAMEIADVFAKKPQTLPYTFGEAAGYPVKIFRNDGEEIVITNAPYLKLY